jgi:Domain of unknown function (DUF4345)
MKTFPIVLLVLAGLGFLGFGAWLVVDPAGGLATVHIAATHPAGLIELRGFYGGLELGLGVFLLMCAARPDWRRAGLWLVALGNGGIGLTRVAGIAMTGVFTPFFGYALVWELGFAALAALCLMSRRVGAA